jgi:hypothetical protein
MAARLVECASCGTMVEASEATADAERDEGSGG